MKNQSIFELHTPILPQADTDSFGPWQINATDPSDSVSFDTTTPTTPPGEVWRVNLPPDLTTATKHFQTGENRLKTLNVGLNQIPTHLDNFVTAFETQQERGRDVSFSTLDNQQFSNSIEGQLWQELLNITTQNQETVSFGLTDMVWPKAVEQFKGLLTRIEQSILYFTRVETKISSHLLGITVVNWDGDSNTVYRHNLATSEITMHHRALALAMSWRRKLLMTLALAGKTALKISALTTVAGGPILALPVLWKFINRTLKSYEEYQALSTK